MWWLLATTAWGAPNFTADDARDATMATAAWTAATACTGRDGHAHAEVKIARDLPDGGSPGTAVVDVAGLSEVHVHPDSAQIYVVAELARAWVSQGPPPLVQGRAELVAECVWEQIPGLSLPDDRVDLVGQPDLRAWTGDVAATWTDAQRNQAAHAASRLVRAAASAVPREKLLATDALDWAGFRALLNDNPAGKKVLAVLDGGAKGQWTGLSDADGDGLVAVQEAILGSNPMLWDTDGDGWWDGAPAHPARAVPMPHDDTPTCAGYVAHSGTVREITGGNVRRLPLFAAANATVARDGPVTSLASSSADARLYPGGEWIEVEGDDLAPDPRCVSTAASTVYADDEATTGYTHLLADALTARIAKLNQLIGAPPTRIVARLGGDALAEVWTPDGVYAHVPIAALSWATKNQALDLLAADVVAYDALGAGGRAELHEPGAAEALAQALLDKPHAHAFAASPGDISAWQHRAAKCATGWSGVVHGQCS